MTRDSGRVAAGMEGCGPGLTSGVDGDAVPLVGGGRTAVSRRGAVVLRPVASWTPAVHALLRHLDSVGYEGAPRVAGSGYDDRGSEMLVYIEGESVHPHAWTDEGVWGVGRLLGGLHEATAAFVPPPGAAWQPGEFRSEAPTATIGHGDTGPWNVVARDGLPVAFIDWECAGPMDRLDDIAQTGWLNAQLHDDDVAELVGLPDTAARARQLGYFLDGYELPRRDREGIVGRMVEVAVRDCAREAAESGITQESTDPTPLWGLAWRARSAAWMLRHRTLLERTILTS